jgi:hypothetical protein
MAKKAKPFDKHKHDELFNEAMAQAKSPIEAVEYLLGRGYNDLTIKQVQRLTDLTIVYIRRRTQEGKWEKSYDPAGRVIIPTHQIESYLRCKAATVGTAYIVRLTEDERYLFQQTFPNKPLTPRYDPEKARAYRARKRAAAEAGGVKAGKLSLAGNRQKGG